MIFSISPKYTTMDFPNGCTLDNKIDIFIDRVEGWQLGIALEIIENKIHHRGYALLHIVFSYFEMIGKYLEGYIGERQSKYYFRKGVRATFPEIEPETEDIFDNLYISVRNGLYHQGMTKTNVVLLDDIQGSIGYNQEKKLLAISPDKLVQDLSIRFTIYASELKNPKNKELRRNFEARFDYDNN